MTTTNLCNRCSKTGIKLYSGCSYCWSKQKEIDYLTDKIVQAKNLVAKLTQELDEVQKAPITVEELQGKLETLEKHVVHLKKFVRHYSECNWLIRGTTCSCGLSTQNAIT